MIPAQPPTERQRQIQEVVRSLWRMSYETKRHTMLIARLSLDCREAEMDDVRKRLDLALSLLESGSNHLKVTGNLIDDAYGAIGRLR